MPVTQKSIRVAGKLLRKEFFKRADNFCVAAFLALPYRQRGSPVSLPGKCPVFHLTKPLSNSSFFQVPRNPVYLFIVRQQLLLHLLHIHEPAVFSVVQERSGTSPAERILMRVYQGRKKVIVLFKIREYLLVRFFCPYPQSCKSTWHLLG